MDSFVPNFNPTKLLHGEQYLRLNKGPLPTSATIVNKVKLVEVLDKGKTAAVTFKVVSSDKSSGEVLCENQSTVILRGSGGFGGKKNGSGKFITRTWGQVKSKEQVRLMLEQTEEPLLL